MSNAIENVLNIRFFDSINANANSTSAVIEISGITCYAAQFSWSGFSAGAATIVTEATNDDNLTTRVFTSVDSFIPSGTTGNRILNVEKAGYKYIRFTYTQTTGAGTILGIVNAKSSV